MLNHNQQKQEGDDDHREHDEPNTTNIGFKKRVQVRRVIIERVYGAEGVHHIVSGVYVVRELYFKGV